MQLKGLGISEILLVLATLPALAQVPSEPISPLTAAVISPRQHGPMRFHGVRPDGTVESDSWSGYAVTGSKFTQAKGSWTVPTVNCNKTPNAYASFSVGIDGFSSATVEQTGTDSDCNGNSPSYYAWYVFASNFAVITSLSISPGNQMSAQVIYSGSKFTITITNESTGKSYSKNGKVTGAKRSSAEWIAEAPCCTIGGGALPLADFGKVSFGADYTGVSDTNDATDTSISGPISDFGSRVKKITMVNGKGKDEAVPSALTSDGTSFKVNWKSK
jgi:hypothetical protein